MASTKNVEVKFIRKLDSVTQKMQITLQTIYLIRCDVPSSCQFFGVLFQIFPRVKCSYLCEWQFSTPVSWLLKLIIDVADGTHKAPGWWKTRSGLNPVDKINRPQRRTLVHHIRLKETD